MTMAMTWNWDTELDAILFSWWRVHSMPSKDNGT